MSHPARRNHKDKINKAIRQQSWALLTFIILVIITDITLLDSGMAWSKNFTSGAVLSFGSQYIAAWLTFRHSGYRARQRIVNNMFLAEIIRWLMTLIGFTLLFIYLKPLIALAIILGFIVLQLSYMVILWKLR